MVSGGPGGEDPQLPTVSSRRASPDISLGYAADTSFPDLRAANVHQSEGGHPAQSERMPDAEQVRGAGTIDCIIYQ